MAVTRERASAFLNIPYDREFQDLYLAYIAGLTAFGITPRAALEIPGGGRRLDRIFDLIRDCRYSFHDLSRIEVDATAPSTPRFNMPFELGLTLGWTQSSRRRHTWFVLESMDRRAEKSISDLKGTDFYVHDGTPEGVFREIGNALADLRPEVTVHDQRAVFRSLKAGLRRVLVESGAKSCFEARAFVRLRLLAASRVA